MPAFLLLNWKWLASALVAALVSYYVTSMPYKVTIAHMEAAASNADKDRANLSLAQFTADADRIHESADAFSKLQPLIETEFAKLSKDFHNATSAHPLPVDCKPDVERLRFLSAAVAQANAAAGRIAVPAVPAAK